MPTRFITCLTILILAAMAYSQEMRDTATTKIGGKTVTIEYGRPALKGRNLAELMKKLPADRIWRAGAGAVTTLNTETDLVIGGEKVSAGKYSLYLFCPESGDYALVINSDLGMPLGSIIPNISPDRADQPYPHFFNYSGEIADKELARIPLKQADMPNSDSFTYSFQPAGKGALLVLSWGDQAWTVDLQPSN